MNIAVAGTGSIGRRHITNLQSLLPRVQFFLIRRDSRTDSYSTELDALVYSTLNLALENHIDALVIANPSSLHAPLIHDGIEYQVPMYIEKPVIASSAQLHSVRQHLSSTPFFAPTQVGCNLRFLPSLQRLRQAVRDGVIGNVVRCSFDAGQWLPDWRPHQNYKQGYSADPLLGGGVLLDLIHEIDSARWILGDLVPIACTASSNPVLGIKSESAATAILRSEEGALVQIGLDYIARRPLRRYQLVGEQGNLTWDLLRQELILETPSECHLLDCGKDGFDISTTYRTAMMSLLSCIRRESTSVQPLQDGLETTSLALSLKELACQSR